MTEWQPPDTYKNGLLLIALLTFLDKRNKRK